MTMPEPWAADLIAAVAANLAKQYQLEAEDIEAQAWEWAYSIRNRRTGRRNIDEYLAMPRGADRAKLLRNALSRHLRPWCAEQVEIQPVYSHSEVEVLLAVAFRPALRAQAGRAMGPTLRRVDDAVKQLDDDVQQLIGLRYGPADDQAVPADADMDQMKAAVRPLPWNQVARAMGYAGPAGPRNRLIECGNLDRIARALTVEMGAGQRVPYEEAAIYGG